MKINTDFLDGCISCLFSLGKKNQDDIDAKNGLLKGKQRRKTFEKYFSRIIAKLDAAAAQSSELPSRKQLSLALDALLYDQRQRREPGFWPLIWENSLKNRSSRVT